MNYGEGGLTASDVALIQGNGRNNDGFGGENSWWIILFILVLFGGWGNRGFGGYGGGSGNEGGSTSVYEGYVLSNDFSQLSKQVSDAYSMTERKLDGINNGLCSLGYQELQNINGVNQNVSNGFYNTLNAITTNGYETRLGQNAINQNISDCCCGIKSQIAQCCCDNLRALDSIKFENAQNTCAITNTMNFNTRDIIDNQNANYRALHDEIIANRLEDKNAQITAQQNEINALRLAASQEKQNAYLLSELKPCPSAAYIVPNPNCCYNYTVSSTGCGCNNGCGC